MLIPLTVSAPVAFEQRTGLDFLHALGLRSLVIVLAEYPQHVPLTVVGQISRIS